MAVFVKLTNSSSTFARIEADTPIEDKLKLSRVLYQHLGSLVKNRELTQDITNPNEFNRLLNLLNEYAETITDPTFQENDTVISEIDEYLGSLGVTEDYPYAKDAQSIPLWVDSTSQEPTRDLYVYVDGIATEAITDSTGEQLVHVTGV